MASLNKPPFIMWRGPLFKLLPPTLLPLDLEGVGGRRSHCSAPIKNAKREN